MSDRASLLEVTDLKVYYNTSRGVVRAVDGVSFALQPGQHLGLIGESGCGKTTTGRALVRVLPQNAEVAGGSMRFKDQDLRLLSEPEMRQLRWRELAMIPQASMASLDPVYRVGAQMQEVLTRRGGYSSAAARERARELFSLVGLQHERLHNYPHEFSGGMKQRAVIAMALALDPALVIADEPVTALDVIVQRQVLETLRNLQERLSLSVIMITHDISVVAETCDRVAVMYAGKIVEQGTVQQIFSSPFHPYTLGLQQAVPSLARPKAALVSIEGAPPDLLEPPAGCRFSARCPFAMERCLVEEPPLVEVEPGHQAACHQWQDVEALRARAQLVSTWQREQPAEAVPTLWLSATPGAAQRERGPGAGEAVVRAAPPASPAPAARAHDEPVLEVRDLKKYYPLRRGLLSWRPGAGDGAELKAVDGVSFRLRRGQSLGLAGESGSGKTTTARLLLKLIEPTAGVIRFNGQDVGALHGAELKAFRRAAQFMFQNPYEALNPRFTIYRSVAEPLLIHSIGSSEAERRERVEQALEQAQLRPARPFLNKHPHQLSGGQLQRVVLARALVLEPSFLVADEPVSMLDVSVRAGILNTMKETSQRLDLAVIYISHDLSLIQYMCDITAVMYLGHIVELGPTYEVIARPQHPYTQALVAAVAVPDPAVKARPLPIAEGIPSPVNLPAGCVFQSRCPHVMPICREDPPAVSRGLEHVAWCHLYDRGSASSAARSSLSAQD